MRLDAAAPAGEDSNLTCFVSPNGYNMLWLDGYAACSYKNGVLAAAYEYGSEAWGYSLSVLWGSPTVTSTSPLTIVRTTTDKRLQLTQVFTRGNLETDVTITMTLNNISGQTLTMVALQRHADIDVTAGPGAADDWGGCSPIRAFVLQQRGMALDPLSSAYRPGAFLDPTTRYACGGLQDGEVPLQPPVTA